MKNIIDILTFQAKGGLWERILRFLEPFLMQHAIVPIKFGLYFIRALKKAESRELLQHLVKLTSVFNADMVASSL